MTLRCHPDGYLSRAEEHRMLAFIVQWRSDQLNAMVSSYNQPQLGAL